jgi:ATP-dependent Clp protease adapter protein ClpS
MITFTEEECRLLEICFDINSGDNYTRYSYFPEILQDDFNISEEQTEQLFRSIQSKFSQAFDGRIS